MCIAANRLEEVTKCIPNLENFKENVIPIDHKGHKFVVNIEKDSKEGGRQEGKRFTWHLVSDQVLKFKLPFVAEAVVPHEAKSTVLLDFPDKGEEVTLPLDAKPGDVILGVGTWHGSSLRVKLPR